MLERVLTIHLLELGVCHVTARHFTKLQLLVEVVLLQALLLLLLPLLKLLPLLLVKLMKLLLLLASLMYLGVRRRQQVQPRGAAE